MFKRLFGPPQRLHIEIDDQKPSELTLTEALVGKAGKLVLGKNGIGLWNPNARIDGKKDIVCDLRFDPLTEMTYTRFREAAEGRYLHAHVVVFRGANKEKIARALTEFDFVIIPNRVIANVPADFRSRVLGYKPRARGPLASRI